MSAPCPINHRDDDTRSRCHNPECRRLAASHGSSTPRSDRPKPPPPTSGRRKTFPDANGDPIAIDLNDPVIKRATLSPESVAALPPGVRFESVNFKPGDYVIPDATLVGCKVHEDARLGLMGNSVIRGCTVRGTAFLGDETFSTGNTYHGEVIMGGTPSSTDDYFALGYTRGHGSRPMVDRSTTTFGADATVRDQEPPADSETENQGEEETYPRKKRARAWMGEGAKNIGMSALWALGGGSRGAGRRRRRRR